MADKKNVDKVFEDRYSSSDSESVWGKGTRNRIKIDQNERAKNSDNSGKTDRPSTKVTEATKKNLTDEMGIDLRYQKKKYDKIGASNPPNGPKK